MDNIYISFTGILIPKLKYRKNGIATSMHGVETKIHRLRPGIFDLDKEILEEFNCKFKIPEPIVKDSAVNNKKIGHGRLGDSNKLDQEISAPQNRANTTQR